MTKAPAASRSVLSFLGEETPMILIDPLMIPAAPAPAVARPTMNIGDEIVVAHMIDPTSE